MKNKKKPEEIYEVMLQNRFIRFNLYSADEFVNLKNVTQVYGIVLNKKNQIILVSGKSKRWILPGGGIEEGETYLDTLNREVYEETAIKLKSDSIIPLFYQEVFWKEDDKWKFEGTHIRFLARINKQEEFTEDPDMNDIVNHLFISVKDIHKKLDWGKATIFMQNLVNKKLERGY